MSKNNDNNIFKHWFNNCVQFILLKINKISPYFFLIYQDNSKPNNKHKFTYITPLKEEKIIGNLVYLGFLLVFSFDSFFKIVCKGKKSFL